MRRNRRAYFSVTSFDISGEVAFQQVNRACAHGPFGLSHSACVSFATTLVCCENAVVSRPQLTIALSRVGVVELLVVSRIAVAAAVALAAMIVLAFSPGASASVFFGGYYAEGIGLAASDGSSVTNPLISAGKPNPLGMAVSGNRLYWINNSIPVTIGRANLDGSSARPNFMRMRGPTEVTSGIWISAGRLYWIAPFKTRGGTVGNSQFQSYLASSRLSGRGIRQKYRRLPKTFDGSAVVTHGSLYSVKRDSSYTYTKIVRAKLRSKKLRGVFFATVSNNTPLAAAGDQIYWIDRDQIKARHFNGSGEVLVVGTATCADSSLSDLTATLDSVYWSCENGQINRLMLSTGAVNVISTGFDLNGGGLTIAAVTG